MSELSKIDALKLRRHENMHWSAMNMAQGIARGEKVLLVSASQAGRRRIVQLVKYYVEMFSGKKANITLKTREIPRKPNHTEILHDEME